MNTNTDAKVNEELRAMVRRRIERAIDTTASNLRDTAERLERAKRDLDRIGQSNGMDGVYNASDVAATVMHVLLWGVANANADAVVSAAADYDRQMARPSES